MMSREKIGLALWGLAGLALLASGTAKVFGAEMMVNALGANTLWVGLIEWACVLAMFLPTTRQLGFFLCASYLGGVIATEWLTMGGVPIPGLVLNTLLYVGIALYSPSAMGYLLGGNKVE
ncbi:hypothetical protein [Neolewinella agarilytica]|nr:hypothetical protein [Neolewinella agarilytica]